ncbi:methyltransferase protein [Apiospora phragmitis]|uniref:Methyltransferase protein n=1 Tax=Apiospora phragmitis TaxID=2905665 RepID=A0ABR1VXV1_9PEZI
MPSQRLFIRKASKALDQSANRIADLGAQVDYLQAKLDRKTTRVRQKVRTAPGQRFIRMADIRRAKRRLRGRVIYEDEASDVEVPGGPRNATEAIEYDGTEAEDSYGVVFEDFRDFPGGVAFRYRALTDPPLVFQSNALEAHYSGSFEIPGKYFEGFQNVPFEETPLVKADMDFRKMYLDQPILYIFTARKKR